MKNLMSRQTYLFGILVMFSLVACEKDEVPAVNETTEQAVRFGNALPDFRPFFERFEVEAAARGLTFDLDLHRLETSLEPIDEGNVVGQCEWHSHAPEHVIIDMEFWENASDLAREYVMFHELGHCILFREHDNSESPFGNCLSIMASGTTDCRFGYNSETREYYLDELFGLID